MHTYPQDEFIALSDTVFSRNDELLKTLTALGLQTDLETLLEDLDLIKKSIAKDYYQNIPLAICHGDLFRGNLLQDCNKKLFFVDWEYAFYGYVIDDIGKFCSSNWLYDEAIEYVSTKYWGTSNDLLLEKLHQNIFMQQFNFFLWCHIQAHDNPKESASFYEMSLHVREHLSKLSKLFFIQK